MGRVIKLVMLVSVLVTGLAVAGCSSSTSPTSVPQPNVPAPDFELPGLDGQTVSLSRLRGRPVMLNFWATWCGPCRAEMHFLQEAFEDKKWSEKGLAIFAINLGESASKVEEFMEENGLSFPVLLDTELEVARMYNATRIPVTYFIDKNGIMKDGKLGPFSNKAEIDWRLVNSIIDE